ncbi:HAAS signaling domain-containing protein [Actinoallomurus vinaceus]|uniref:HAAS signaling domain-containing protein n=1 Tax=Actinoallomurus vinaceus TaxID=1080074 RepID=UPI0031E961DD
MTDELIGEYLGRLEAAARGLPPDRRAELVAEIREHIDTVLAQSPDRTEATVRTILDRLGTPEEIVQEAGVGLPETAPVRERAAAVGQASPRPRAGAFEIAAVMLLLIGGVVLPVLGWLVGVVLLWASARWTLRDKLIGSLLFPGGLAIPVFYFFFWSGSATCSGTGDCESSGTSADTVLTLSLVAFVGSLASAAYLLHRARRAGD